MKKIALLLALIMLFGSLFACRDNNAESESDNSQDASSGDGSTTEELSVEYETIVSIGKSYSYDKYTPDNSYPDSYTSELTDGVYAQATDYSNETFCGIAPAGNAITVILDLGEDGSRLYKFGISYLATTAAGIGAPGSSSVYVSDDKEKWTKVGFFNNPKFEEGTVQQTWCTADSTLDARYVRFYIRPSSAWLFLDELIVVADVKGSHAMTNYLEQLSASYGNSPLSEGDVTLPSGAAVDTKLNKYSASSGRSYSFSRPASSKYTSSGLILTDGIETGASYNTDNWLGWETGEELTIDLPLGITYDNIASLGISMLCQPALGIMLPYYVDFYVSTDNENFQMVGRIYAPNDASVTNYTYDLCFANCVTAKYVRFVCAKTECSYFFCEELSASYYAEKSMVSEVYQDVVLETAGSKVYHNSASAKVKNLVSGLTYQISASGSLAASTETKYNSSVTLGHLTDGKRAKTTDYTDEVWFRTHYGTARNIYFDLGYQASITGLDITFLRNIPVGIGLPGSVTLYLSDDGINWYSVARVSVPQYSEDLALSKAKTTLESPVEARYIRVSFGVAGHVYLDEIEIFGSEKLSSGTLTLDECKLVSETTGKYTQSDSSLLGGTEDLILAYLSKATVLNKDFFLPYVGYLDKEGNIKDTLFDGYLFLPSGNYLPTGYAYDSADHPNNAGDWQYLVEQMFTAGINFDALDQATGDVKTALGLTDYKTKVYATICYISTDTTNFGDIDGDGTNEDLSTIDGIKKVFDWYMDEVLSRFDKAGYKNIEFGGFYWFHEAISTEHDDYTVINTCADEAEARGEQLFWIPYYQASGFSEWSSYGFSVACMQPNYAFNAEVSSNRIDLAVANILQYGMGIELEISSQALSDKAYFRKYMNYLSYGIKYGYMDESIHMYYAGVTDYYKACYSDSAMARAVYDRTYEFIKGTLGKNPPEAKELSFSVAADTPLSGILFTDDTGLLSGRISVYAQHGCVTVNSDGSFNYYPNKGFTGTDTFSYVINDYIVDSASAKVTVTVG